MPATSQPSTAYRRPGPFFLLAVLLFGLIQCLFFSNLHFFDLDSVNYANRFDFEGTVLGIERVKVNPNIIFLGTSLLRYPFYGLDEELLHSKIRTEDAHVCQSAPGSLNRNYSFAIAGILVSDFNLIFRKFMNRDITSGTVYVECSPRAFYDSGLQPNATPAFKFFCDLHDVFSSSKAFSNEPERWQWLANILLPTYRFRHDIQENLGHLATACMTQIEEHTQIKHEAVGHGTAIGAVSKKTPQAAFNKSIAEYQGRYAGISIDMCSPQLSQLQDLICQVKTKNAKPVLLVMPLTQANLELLPNGFYADWKNSVKQVALDQHCTILDLSEYHFENSDFLDSVHLNKKGAAKFLNILEAHNHH